MKCFSDDGQWWWDGDRWTATQAVVLPDLAATEYERSGRLTTARSRMARRNRLRGASLAEGVGLGSWRAEPVLGVPLGLLTLTGERRVIAEYRAWTLEQLGLVTRHLLDPELPMLAAETALYRTSMTATIVRDLALVVTRLIVLVLRFDSLDGQPRWIALAAPPTDVVIRPTSGPFGGSPTLLVSRGARAFSIRGTQRVLNPEPIVHAWRRAASGAA
jgi:hypothetical protein